MTAPPSDSPRQSARPLVRTEAPDLPLPGAFPWAQVPFALRLLTFSGAIYGLGLAAVLLRPEGSQTALWWPAAGLGVAGMVLAGRRQRPWIVGAVLVASTLANAQGGQELGVSACFGVANALEALVAGHLLTRGVRGRAPLVTLHDVGRLALAAAAGALLIGVAAAGTVALLLDGAFLPVVSSVTSSHFSAVVLIAPLAMRTTRVRLDGHPLEAIAQWLLLAAVLALAFQPGQSLPLSFLPLAVMTWAALRTHPRVLITQLLIVNVAVSLLTLEGGGPFAVSAVTGIDDAASTINLVQLYIVASAAVMLPLVVTVDRSRTLLLELGARETLFREGFRQALLGMVLLRREGDEPRVAELNEVAAGLLGQPQENLLGHRWMDLVPVAARPEMHEALTAMTIGGSEGWRGEVEFLFTTGTRWLEVALSPLPGVENRHDQFTMQLIDVTPRHEAEQALVALALHDTLTGLPNRRLVCDRADQALSTASRDHTYVGLLFVDLDDFKAVNDTAGHDVGDQVLVRVSERLSSCLRPGDTLARIGGDEFVVLLPGLETPELPLGFAERLTRSLQRPMAVHGAHYTVGASIGVRIGDGHSIVEDLLRDADAAMYAAKDAGKGRITTFRGDQVRGSTGSLARELASALHRDEFRLHVQPVVDVESGRIVAAETLVRWQHPTRGLLLPGEWLAEAESTDFMHDLGAWILDESARLACTWAADDRGGLLRVHVNVSSRQLRHPDLAGRVGAVLGRTGIAPERLVLEITETAPLAIDDRATQQLAQIRALGVRLAVDDFGTGYSSLSHLVDLPTDVIKIDRRFVSTLRTSPASAAVVAAALSIGEALGLEVVGEGVETAVEARALRDAGCGTAQGYLWSPAVEPEAFAALVARGPLQTLPTQLGAGPTLLRLVEGARVFPPRGPSDRDDLRR